jgi:peptidoglycan/LPS O-acetylase OafA/YrhL
MPNRQKSHLPGIHGLRAIAALGVMFAHTALVPSPSLTLPPVFNRVVPLLPMCVTLFFVISAYSLLHSHERSSGRPYWVRAYLIKRLFRIAPLFYAMLILYCLIPTYHGALTFGMVAANVLFIYNFFPSLHESLVPAGWTIGVEMPFYLCLPLALGLVRNVRGATVLFAATVVLGVAHQYWLTQQFGTSSDYPGMGFLTNVYAFAGGMLAYHSVQARPNSRVMWLTIGIAGVAALVSIPVHDPIPVVEGRPDMVVWTAAMCMVCAWQAAAPSRILASRPMQWLGERSFSIYLLHPFVVITLMRHGTYAAIYRSLEPIGAWAYLACVGLTAAIVVTAAAVTYRAIEMPGQAFGAALIRRSYARPAIVPAAALAE